MVIKRRTSKVRKKLKKRAPSGEELRAALDRMGDIIAAGHGTEAEARAYYEANAKDHLARLQSIVATAETNRSWKHLDGCYSQAMMLYVFAGAVYEKHPAHVFMSDVAFDRLARWLLKNWNKLDADFRIWYNVTSIGLTAGTALGVETDKLIKWMVAIHTDTPMEVNNARNRSRLLRGNSKRGSVGGKTKPRRKVKRPLRRST